MSAKGFGMYTNTLHLYALFKLWDHFPVICRTKHHNTNTQSLTRPNNDINWKRLSKRTLLQRIGLCLDMVLEPTLNNARRIWPLQWVWYVKRKLKQFSVPAVKYCLIRNNCACQNKLRMTRGNMNNQQSTRQAKWGIVYWHVQCPPYKSYCTRTC